MKMVMELQFILLKKIIEFIHLICFANKLSDKERSDRVIATKWDAAFTLI